MRTVRVRGIIYSDGGYLFVQHAHDASFWALPGGKLEQGESLQDGLSREIHEELGVRPSIGRLLFVQQLFRGAEESLEFFFEITNGADFNSINLKTTSHGQIEIARCGFIDPSQEHIMPRFLKHLPADGQYVPGTQVFIERH